MVTVSSKTLLIHGCLEPSHSAMISVALVDVDWRLNKQSICENDAMAHASIVYRSPRPPDDASLRKQDSMLVNVVKIAGYAADRSRWRTSQFRFIFGDPRTLTGQRFALLL